MQLKTINDYLLFVRLNWKKVVTKHSKRAVSFRLKNNETRETACFASKRNFAKQQVCFAKHETCFVLCFAKYETKLVSLETLDRRYPLFICNECKVCCLRAVKRFLGMWVIWQKVPPFLFAMNVMKYAVLELWKDSWVWSHMTEGVPFFICNEFNECYKICCFRAVKRLLGMWVIWQKVSPFFICNAFNEC
jgi:hypothetical protein